MADGQVLIKDLPETTTVSDSSFIPVDDGNITKKITVENFNASSNATAKAYAEASAASATTAQNAVADVNTKVDAAQAQANIATTQAGYAQTYAGNAQTYAGNAQGYANSAQGSATNAAASANAASASADAANDNAVLSRSWAEGNTGARVDENTNNARYWANKAQTAAQQTIDNHLDPQSTNPVENQAIYNAINSLHTGGSNIVITTTEVTLRGQNCTITDGTTSYTEAFDLTGKAVFEGVQITGAISISSTDGSQTATDSLTVPYFGNYTKNIAFWRATIAVTTNTTEFNGLTVSAKKGGVVMGTGTFSNGSASIVVPSPGTYKLEVTLDWKTFESDSFSVSAETTYNETIDGFVAPISLSTPTTDFYGASIAVTLDGNPIATTLAFDNTGAATFDALQAGVYLFTLTYGGEPYTATVTVSAETSYSAVIKMWTATVNLSTSSTELLLQTIVVKKNGIQVGTTLFSAGGTASYIAHEAGTYTFECTYDSYPFSSDPVAVSEETTYNTTITAFTATLNISTPSAELYSRPITIQKGSTTVGTTAFSSSGSATYRVHETGIYTLTCDGYDASVTVSAETTYSVSISAVQTYNITATIYSAASDTITYTDDNGAQTVTTDSTGKAENVSITITQPSAGVDPSITFTSSIAKDPSNLSNDYSKSITITDGTAEIYVMPDKVIYWYGYKDNVEAVISANGWSNAGIGSVYNLNSATFNTNNIKCKSAAMYDARQVSTQTAVTFSKFNVIAKGIGGTQAGALGAYADKNTNWIAGISIISIPVTSAPTLYTFTMTEATGYPTMLSNNSAECDYYAAWYE